MQSLAKVPVENISDVALTCKHLANLSPERQIEITSLFCNTIGLLVDEVPEYRKNLLSYVLRASDTEKIIGYVKVDSSKTGIIPVSLVEELEQYMRLDGVENGIIFSIQPFSEEALLMARGKNIELVDVRNLYDNILILPEEAIAKIEEAAYAVRFTAPICPKCKSVMDKANNKVGAYWKCRNYPDCRQTFMW